LSTCPRCSGTGFEIVEKEDGRVFAHPCSCRREVATGPVGADAFLLACRIPPRYEHCSFANFDAITRSHEAALTQAMQYASRYPFLGADEGLGLLLTGGTGLGKTHLAVSVLREIVAMKGVSGQFWDFQQLIREIKSSYDPETKTTELQVLSPVIETDVLVLDDLGAWRITDWMNDTLFQIINSRYLARRPTVITTNFRDVPPQHAAKADHLERKEFLIDRVGQRLRSRLMEMCLKVQIEGDDFRERKQESHKTAVIGTSQRDAPPPPPPPKPRFGG
jgi:DNA replication protein DnaC